MAGVMNLRKLKVSLFSEAPQLRNLEFLPSFLPGGNQLGPSRSEGLGAISRSAQPGDSRAPSPGTMLGSGTRESSIPGTPARSSWLTHYTGRNSEPPKSWQRKHMLTLEGIYRPQIPWEAPCLHEPSAVFNLQLLVLPGGSRNC